MSDELEKITEDVSITEKENYVESSELNDGPPPLTSLNEDLPPPLTPVSADGPPSLPPAQSAANVPGEWWYNAGNGERKGPVFGRALDILLSDGGISYGTDVWRQGFQEWQKAEDTDLLGYLRQTSPSSVYKAKVDNTMVWCVAFAPIVRFFVDVSLFTAVAGIHITLTGVILNIVTIVFCGFDASNLKKAGHDMGKWTWIWILFLVPVYLYKRARMLKEDCSYLITWFFLYVVWLSGLVGMLILF